MVVVRGPAPARRDHTVARGGHKADQSRYSAARSAGARPRHGGPLLMPKTSPVIASAAVASSVGLNTGCASLSPPFDQMKSSAMTVYRLQNYEPPAQAAGAAGAAGGLGGLTVPPQIQQWITAGASLLPPGLLPPGLVPGTAPQAPPAPDAQRFHNFRILDYRQIDDASVKGDIVDLFGHGSSFQSSPTTCLYAAVR